MKLKALLLALTILGAANFPANASPVTMTGDKGVYIIDLQAGTYQGCVKGNGCLSLGPSHRIGHQAWRNGDYKYQITEDGERVIVIKNGTVIFSDYVHQ